MLNVRCSCFLLLAGVVLADDGVSLEMRLGRILERDLAGETAGALAEYRTLLDKASTNTAMAGRILYRIGLCEQRLGKAEDARRTWRKLVESCPPADPQVVRAREALRLLERELDRIVLEGKISVQNAEGLSLNNSTTQQLNNCILLAGEWGNEPALLVGSNGAFRVRRQVAGQLKDGRRYCYLFAEHPTLPLVAASVMLPQSGVLSPPPQITLQPAIDLVGQLVDDKGEPVTGALIRVVGYWRGEENRTLNIEHSTSNIERKGAEAPGGPPFDVGSSMLNVRRSDSSVDTEEIPLPFDNILPPVISGGNGEFLVKGLPPGVRYAWTAEKAGGRLAVSEMRTSNSQHSTSNIERKGAEAPGGPPFDVGSSMLNVRSSPLLPPPLRWLRGDPESGGALSQEALKGRVVVYHYGSAYVEGSVRALYPGEPGTLSQLVKLYGEQGLVVIWVLPEDEGKGEAARMALELYPDLSVAVGGPDTPAKGNLVVGREGTVHPSCSDQALFKSVKQALGY